MALKTPPALVLASALLVLAVALSACGGGSTAAPVPAATDAPAASAPAASAPPPQSHPTAPPATTTSAQAAPAPAPSTAAQPRGGAAAPDVSAGDAASADSSGSSAAAADEASPAPTATTPTTEQPAAAEPDPAGSQLDETAELTLVERVSPAHYFQQGTVTGTYDGTMEVEARITSRGVVVSFTATLPGGTISGRGIAIAILDSATWPALRGTAAVTGGTGRFAEIRGRRLRVTGRARPDASKARVRLAGTVTY